MSATTSRRGRQLAGLVGLLGAAVLVVAGRAATAPAPTQVALGGPATPPAPGRGSAAAPPAAPSAAPPSAAPPSAPRPPGATAAPAPAATAASSPAPVSGSFLGAPEFVTYGSVQVRVVLTAGRITDVHAVQMPAGGRSSEIASYAAPRLRAEVLAAQSAHIDTVSGASYDSEGYARSVQSALDAAPR